MTAENGSILHCATCGYLLENVSGRVKLVVCPNCRMEYRYLLNVSKGRSRRIPGGRIRIINGWNPLGRRGRVQFAFESFDHPGLRGLAAEYDHARAMENQPDEIHAQLALMNWFNRRLLSGGKAIEVYDKVRRRKAYDNGFNRKLLDTDCSACSGFSFSFVPIVSSVGHVARVVNICSEDTVYGKHTFAHMVVEIWSNQYVKWVVLDTLFNHSWWREGVPLSALEVRDEFLRDGGARVQTRWGVAGPPLPRVPEVGPTAGSPSKFQWVLYYTANNFVAFPVTQKFWRALLFRDRHNRGRPFTIYPAATQKPYAGELLLDETTDRDDWNWPINLSELNIACARPGTLDVCVYTHTPNLSHFVVGRSGNSMTLRGNRFEWRLKPGRNRLTVHAVNTLGVYGPESFVELDWIKS